MPRSASTWQYQVASELVERRLNGIRLGFLPGGSLPATAAATWAVVKWHDADADYARMLAAGKALALYSYRDIRDVVYSAAYLTGQTFGELVGEVGFIEKTLASDAFWRAQRGVLCQEYDEIVRDPVGSVMAIAAHLGLPIDSATASDVAAACSVEANANRMRDIREALERKGVDLASPEHVLDHDARSQVHWNHIREGAPANWRALATREERATLRLKCSAWLAAQGYELDSEPDLPTLTVVVPTLNRAAYLRPTIDSILNQDYPNIECVVVDAASTDGTREILASYGDRIRWVSEPDRGPFDAVNKGWAMSSGEICAWLSADDTFTPGAVAIAMRAFAEHPEVDVVHGLCATIAPSGRVARLWGSQVWDYVTVVRSCSCTIEQPAAFTRRRMIERVGGVHDIPVLDFDLWLRISATGGKFLALDDHLANAQDHPDRITNNPAIMVPAVVEAIRRALSDPAAPPRIRRNAARALSSAYAHGFYFVGQREWSWVARSAVGAVRADWTNTPHVLNSLGWGLLGSIADAIEEHPKSPRRLRRAVRASRRGRAFLRRLSALAGATVRHRGARTLQRLGLRPR